MGNASIRRNSAGEFIAFREFYQLGNYPNQLRWSHPGHYQKHFEIKESVGKQDIINYQKNIIKQNYINSKNSQLIKYLERDIKTSVIPFDINQLESGIVQSIQDSFFQLNSGNIKTAIKEGDVLTALNLLGVCKNKWSQVWDQMSQSNISSSTLEHALNDLKRNIDAVENKTLQLCQTTKSPTLVLLVQENRIETTKSFFRSMAGIGSVLKGLLLEIYGEQYLNKVFGDVSNLNNFIAIQTGSLNVGGKSAKSDILIFDKNIKIKINNKLVSISDLPNVLKDLSKNSQSITLDDWNSLLQAAKTGINVKNTNSNRITFHKGFSWDNLVNKQNENLVDSANYWNLYHYWQIYTVYKSDIGLSKNQSIRNTANYIMSRYIPQIIGEKNYLFMTKQGIQTTGSFILDQLNKGKIFTIHNFGPGKELDIGLNITK